MGIILNKFISNFAIAQIYFWQSPFMTSISTLKTVLIPGTKVVITAHYHPDSDAIGSTLAFQGYLAKKGIQATVAVPSAVAANLKWMPGAADILA